LHQLAAATTPYAAPVAWRFITQFLFFAGIAAASGASAVYYLAVRPAVRRAGPRFADDGERVLTRARVVTAIAGVILLLVIYPQLAGKVTRSVKGISYGTGLQPSTVLHWIGKPAPAGDWLSAGTLFGAQFALFAGSAILLIIAALPALRRASSALIGLGAIGVVLAELILIVPGGPGDTAAAALFSEVLTNLHPIAGCLWLGGVTALVATAAAGRRLSPEGGAAIWPVVWRRFAIIAEVAVSGVIVTGLWVAWESLGSFDQFFTTVFGRVLLAKMVVVALLLLIGALNEFVMLPRIVRLRAAGDDTSLFRVAVRDFPRLVAVEVVLGIAVIAIVPFLAGSGREETGGMADPAPTGAILGALLIVLLIVVTSFALNLRFAAGHRDARKQEAHQPGEGVAPSLNEG
jgi:putative copper export protein